jgi:hypothetical protein
LNSVDEQNCEKIGANSGFEVGRHL